MKHAQLRFAPEEWAEIENSIRLSYPNLTDAARFEPEFRNYFLKRCIERCLRELPAEVRSGLAPVVLVMPSR